MPPPLSGSRVEVDTHGDYDHQHHQPYSNNQDQDYSDYGPDAGVINSPSSIGGSNTGGYNLGTNFSNNHTTTSWNLTTDVSILNSDLNGSKAEGPSFVGDLGIRPYDDINYSPDELACHLGISLDTLTPFDSESVEGSGITSGSNLNGTLSSMLSASPYGNFNASDVSGGEGASFTGDLTRATTTSPLGSDWDPLGLLSPSRNNGSMFFCPRRWDGILCWPETQVGLTATLPCFSELNGIPYDNSHNATRFCDDEGWNNTNYDFCKPLNPSGGVTDVDASNLLTLTTGVYFFGYCLSLAALIIAIIIFLSFKELRCLRNTIHTHLLVTYILADTLWIITSSTTFTSSAIPDAQLQAPGQSQGQGNHVSCATFILLHYFHLTNFFWMFVEGLYLYVLVVQTFVAENIKLRVYVSIGWGLPLTVVIGWIIAKWLTQPEVADIQSIESEFESSCPWLTVSHYDWIFKGPAILVLVANILFLVQIMWVLIRKLRSATNPETQQSMKAAKALVVLMPLFGITYLLVLSGSKEPIYEFIRASLISTQGLLVAFFYCFLNGEVRKALRHRWNRLRTMGPGGGISCCDFNNRRRQMQQMRDWSPRSRAESIRLYTHGAQSFRKRESSASEATTMTTFHGSLNSNGLGGGLGHRLSSAYIPASQRVINNTNMESSNTFI